MPLKPPATMAEQLESGRQSKPQPGLPHWPVPSSTPCCKPPGSCPLLPWDAGSTLWQGKQRAGRQVPVLGFESSGMEGPAPQAHHCKSR